MPENFIRYSHRGLCMFNRTFQFRAEMALLFGAGIVSGRSTGFYSEMAPIALLIHYLAAPHDQFSLASARFISFTAGFILGASVTVFELTAKLQHNDNSDDNGRFIKRKIG